MSYQGLREFHQELDGLSLDELVQRFRASAPDDEWAGIYYSDIAICIAQHGEDGLRLLFDEEPAVEHDGNRLRAALEGLSYGTHDDPAIRAFFMAHLSDSRPLIVMDSIDGLWRIGAAMAHDAVIALRDHPSPYVRGGVLRYLQHLFPDEAIPALLSGLHDPQYIVRQSAIDGLDELGVIVALPAIRPFVTDAHPHVRQAAETALRHLEELARESEREPCNQP